MVGSIPGGNMEEMDCGSFFDHIDDLLDFPLNGEDIESGLPGKFDSFPSIWSTESDSVFSNTDSDLPVQLSVPYEDIVQLEWLSNFVEDSFSGGGGSLAINNSTSQDSSNPSKDEPFRTQFHTTSPVSVLDSSSSSYCERPAANCSIPVPGSRKAKARSKRSRPATFSPSTGIQQLISPTASSVAENLPSSVSPKALSDSENYAESWPAPTKIPKQSSETGEPKKKKKIRLTIVQGSSGEGGGDGDGGQSGQAVRKCLHCDITKTPQWRAGPLGPKTLCNACGVRYKSGRLFPEYRPAASPTFIPSVHSNSHKKVLEMRNKVAPSPTAATPPELIPNTAVPLDYI